jgi:ABC-2 type transport system permease protein
MPMSRLPERAGAIYDLGYRRYDGFRLGRRSSLLALFTQGLRSAFGLGRRPASKIAPFALASLALIPAAIYLGIAAIAPGDLDLIAAEDYLEVIFITLILFVAAVGPEVVGRDLRYRTLALYFTRPIERDDYAIARIGALAVACLAVTLVPQTVLYIGNTLAADSVWEYLQDEWADAPRIIASGAVAALYVSAVGLAIACHTHRRSFAMGGIVALFIITGIVAEVLAETVSGAWLMLDPGIQIRAVTLLIFNRDANADEPIATEDVPIVGAVIVLMGVIALALSIILRRYRMVRA